MIRMESLKKKMVYFSLGENVGPYKESSELSRGSVNGKSALTLHWLIQHEPVSHSIAQDGHVTILGRFQGHQGKLGQISRNFKCVLSLKVAKKHFIL